MARGARLAAGRGAEHRIHYAGTPLDRALASCIFLRRNVSADHAINEGEINLSLDMAVPPVKRKDGTGD
jgi:hypothetical protein